MQRAGRTGRRFFPQGKPQTEAPALPWAIVGYRSTEAPQVFSWGSSPPLGSFLLRSSFSGQKGLIYFPRSVRPLNVVFTLLGFPAHFINGPECFVGGPSHG
jgi:hypothetical protein